MGSFNLDPRSAFLATETMAIVDSKEFQKDLEAYVQSLDTASWDEAAKDKAPVTKRILLFIVRILMYFFSPLV